MNDKQMTAAPPEVFRVWNNRLKIELEAAHLFSSLAEDIRAVYGQGDEIEKLASIAAADELRHADFCREILKQNGTQLTPLNPTFHSYLGPLPKVHERLLYTSVAMGCVTETLSTALLIEMRLRADPGIIHDTIHEILIDEVNHSRIGWAELSRWAQKGDVTWLSKYIPAMIAEAIQGDVNPMTIESRADYSKWGILPMKEAREIMNRTIENVIFPGLKKYGISTPYQP